MDSDPHLQKQLHLNHRQPPPAQQQQQQQIMSSGNSGGLTRYRSAPSSYFASLMSGGSYGAGGDDDCDQFLDMPETERFFSRYMSEVGGGATESSSTQNLCQIGGNEPQFVNSPLKLEQEDQIRSQTQQLQQPPPTPQQQPQMVFRSPNQLGQQNSVTSTSALDDSLMAVSSMAMNRLPPMKIGSGSNSNLIRQSSSPAGFLSQLNLDNGFSVLRAMESFGGGRGSGGMDPSFSSANRLKNHINYSTGSASPLLNPIPENGGKIMGMSSPPGDGSFGVTHSKDDSYAARFASGAWDDSILSDDFLKELGDGDRNAFSTLMSDNQRDEGGNRNPPALAHQLSLPTSLAEMSAMDKLLFQDSVPLKIRAKRGCATHPRSIAERVRRTRISERMRKLQELVPNMDKQTNTADMLDLAVDYIKDLQKKVETLSDTHSKCTCPNKQKL